MIVVKVGGGAGIDYDALCADIAALNAAGQQIVLVHGGSHETNLLAERVPVEHHRGTRVGAHLDTFAALDVGVEDDAALVRVLHQNEAHRRRAAAIRGRQRHRLGQCDAGGLRLSEPAPEARDRVGGRTLRFGHSPEANFAA